MKDHNKSAKFDDKDYRHAYMETAVRGDVARQIQALRHQAGLTQAEFAELIGTRQSVVSRLESADYGKVSVQTLLTVAGAADVALIIQFVSVEEFLFRMQQSLHKGTIPRPYAETMQKSVAPRPSYLCYEYSPQESIHGSRGYTSFSAPKRATDAAPTWSSDYHRTEAKHVAAS